MKFIFCLCKLWACVLIILLMTGCAGLDILRQAEQGAAKISDYPVATAPAGDDTIIGTDVSDLTTPTGRTKRFRLRDFPVSDPARTALDNKQDAIAAATDGEITTGTETNPRLMSPAQAKLAAETFGGGVIEETDPEFAVSPAASITSAGSGSVISTAERNKLTGIEEGADANPAAATDGEITTGTETGVRLVSPAQLKLAVETHGGTGDGADAYVYIAYASDASGTGFATTPSEGLDYIAALSTDTEITSPQASDFAGLWKEYRGPQGPQGEPGETGAAGTDGALWHNGSGAPADGTGINGDYYIDTTNHAYYGPKASGTWTGYGPYSLQGPQGVQGETGETGPTGATGAQGPQGATGPTGATGPAGADGVDGADGEGFEDCTPGSGSCGIEVSPNTVTPTGAPADGAAGLRPGSSGAWYYYDISGGAWDEVGSVASWNDLEDKPDLTTVNQVADGWADDDDKAASMALIQDQLDALGSGFDEDGDYTPTGAWDWSGVGGLTVWPVWSWTDLGDKPDLTTVNQVADGWSDDDEKAATMALIQDQLDALSMPTASSLSVDDLITLSGVAEGAAHLGAFTGTTIADNQTIKTALQSLETAVEGAGGHDAVTLSTAAGNNLLSLSTQEIGLDTQTANYVFAGPTTGGAATPAFRALVAGDIPDLSGTYAPRSDSYSIALADPYTLTDAVGLVIPIDPSLAGAITVTSVVVSCDADPTDELDFNLMYADALIGKANATLVRALNTTSGAGSFSSGWNDNTIDSGKALYLLFDTAPTESDVAFVSIKINYTY
jgi:hypothetical protein